jgi:hypothetical protein
MIVEGVLEKLAEDKQMLVSFAQLKLLVNNKRLEELKKKDPSFHYTINYFFPNSKVALEYIRNHYNKERDGELLGNIALQVSLLGVCEDLGEQKKEAGL